ncbi:hypothetical protein ES288_A06G080300v1 [Gossypium darwinii]|uniref:Uncharacterized protein n=2 Tax=Gossypium TaxID=3633 RepID=A0A5D2Q1R8_GOSTO|nr:hypothetical protein ES288_A06G080300v1 [Gossypium darwinii]TYI22023.1 hypothetical protein ES332_A06G077500v1 [Gossypium tomentosum]
MVYAYARRTQWCNFICSYHQLRRERLPLHLWAVHSAPLWFGLNMIQFIRYHGITLSENGMSRQAKICLIYSFMF